jgi:hypothetical protein
MILIFYVVTSSCFVTQKISQAVTISNFPIYFCCVGIPCTNPHDHSGLALVFPSFVLQKMIDVHHKSFYRHNWRPLFIVDYSRPLLIKNEGCTIDHFLMSYKFADIFHCYVPKQKPIKKEISGFYTIHTVHCPSNTHHFIQQMHSYYTLLCYTIQSQWTRPMCFDPLLGSSSGTFRL